MNIYHTAMLDPLTVSILSIDEIYKMVVKFLMAHQDFFLNIIKKTQIISN